MEDIGRILAGMSEEKSLHRYAPEKWSIRQVLSHLNDTERAFAFRALWFAREFHDALASFDQNIASNAAGADKYSLASHVREFREIRRSDVALFRKLPSEAWGRSGVASGNFVSVSALAYIIAGHVSHHVAILESGIYRIGPVKPKSKSKMPA